MSNRFSSFVRGACFALATIVSFLASGGAEAGVASVRVYNNSRYDIYFIHVAPTYKDYYGSQDLLYGTILHSGYNILIDFDVDDAEDKCWLDVIAKTTAARGKQWTTRMNVCKETEWKLGN